MRVSPNEKRLIEEAAELAKRAVSNYARLQVVTNAQRDVDTARAEQKPKDQR
jgi:uncharacterized protein (DUF1778 family)